MGATRSSPNSLYHDRVEVMKTKTKKEQTRSDTTNPDLCRNAIKYRNRHKHRDTAEIMLPFIKIK